MAAQGEAAQLSHSCQLVSSLVYSYLLLIVGTALTLSSVAKAVFSLKIWLLCLMQKVGEIKQQ